MYKHLKISVFLFLALTIGVATAQTSWGQNKITFVGVTHMINPNGVYTNLGLGINVKPDSVSSACVTDPDGITVHCYSPEEFREEGSDLYYWISLPGPPKKGIDTFAVEFTDGTVDTASDEQGPLVELPIIKAWQVTVDDNHTTTPTFSWPDVSNGNYYRILIWDEFGNTLFRSSRSTVTMVTIPPGMLQTGIDIRARVEVHDGESFVSALLAFRRG